MNSIGSIEIALDNPKNATNVGSILRAALCFGGTQVYYTGKRFDYAARFHTDTNQVRKKIPLTAIDKPTDAKSAHQQLVAVELVVGATPLTEFQHPEHAVYLFGPEDGSLAQSTIDTCDAVVYIPSNGCLNLAASASILLYDRIAKQGAQIDHVERVKASRDANNRLITR